MRAFIAYDLPKEVREEIYKRIPKFYGIKYVSKEELHITIKFLGDVGDEEINFYKNILNSTNLKKINAELDGIGFFPSKEFIRVVWVGVKGNFDEELIKKLKIDNFIPHITVGRVKRRLNEDEIEKFEKIKFNKKFEIKNLTIYKSTLTSNGPIYEIIKRYEL